MVNNFQKSNFFFKFFHFLSVFKGFRGKIFFFEALKKYVATYLEPSRKPRDAGVMRATGGLCGRSAGYAGAMRVHTWARAGAMRGIHGLCLHCGRDAGCMRSTPTEKRQKSSGARALCTPPLLEHIAFLRARFGADRGIAPTL